MYLMGGWYGSEMPDGRDLNGIMIPGYETEMVGAGAYVRACVCVGWVGGWVGVGCGCVGVGMWVGGWVGVCVCVRLCVCVCV